MITDVSGNVTQHIEYVPYGEVFVEERNGTWHTPYLFNGKERDEETGLLYYGARYQDSKYGIWYSVDPLAEKYAGVSSYVYCLSNPVIFIDPDGRGPKKGTLLNNLIDRLDLTKLFRPDPNAEARGIAYNLYENKTQVLPALEGGARVWEILKGVFDDDLYRTISIGELEFKVNESGCIDHSNWEQGGYIDLPIAGLASKVKFASEFKAFIHYAKHVKNLKYNYVTRAWKITKNAGSLANEVKSFSEYKSLALSFFNESKSSLSFISKEGTLFKFDISKGYFGIVDKNGTIQTFFKFKEIKEGLKYYIKQIEIHGTK